MSRSRTIPRQALRAAMLLAAGAVFPASGQEAKPASTGGKLLWWNGQSLTGQLIDAEADSLRWRSPLFAEPADLALTELRSLSLPADVATTEDSFSFILRDGSRVFGEIAAVDAAYFTLKSSRQGSLRIARDTIASMDRLRGGGILWSGPFGHHGWIYHPTSGSAPAEGRRWFTGEGGSLATVAFRQRTTLPWELDQPVEIAFRIRSSERPEFELRLLNQGFTDNITTWGDEIVLRRGGYFVPLLTLGEADRTVALRLFWDPRSSRGAVTTPEGKLLGSWEIHPPGTPTPAAALTPVDGIYRFGANKPIRVSGKEAALPPDGITWTNRGRDLTIESLTIREWNGELPAEIPDHTDPLATRIGVTAGGVVDGRILRLESGALITEAAGSNAERRIPLTDLVSLRFPESSGNPPPKIPESTRATIQFSDGTTLEGNLIRFSEGKITTQTAFTPDPVESSSEGLREIRWSSRPAPKTTPAGRDTLAVGSAPPLLGTWVPTAGSNVNWQLIGAKQPIPLAASKTPVEITRATPEDRKWPKAKALFFLQDGQIAPAELVAIDQDGQVLHIRGDIIGAAELPGNAVNAVQFPGPDIQPDGFSDPGWHRIRGGSGTEIAGDAAKSITLESGESIGHPSILVGDEIQFELLASGYGTVRARTFTDGSDRESPSTRLLIAHYGNEVYAGIEETEGNFENYKQVPVEQNKPVKIRLSWNSRQIEVFVNGTLGYTAKLDPEKSPRTGRGLIFEPANLWGNGERTVTLSNFKLRVSPGHTWVPPVSAKIRERALFLPRFRKDDPPAHLLVAHTGDLLSGTIEAATADHIAFRAGLESVQIPRDRTAAAIWLKPPAPKEEAQSLDQSKRNTAAALPDAFGLPVQPSHWLILRSGARLGLAVESFGPDAVVGTSGTLGRCRIPIEHVHLIRTSEPSRDGAGGSLAGWQLIAAPQPSPEGAAGGGDSPLVGKPAPKLSLPLLGGGTFDLNQEKGRVVVLDFWATWCGPCVRALPEMIEAFSQLDQKRVKFIAVNQAESPEAIQAFLKSRAWSPLSVALDGDQAAGRAFGVEGIPHTVIIGPDGKIVEVSTGFRPGGAAETAERVRKLLEPQTDP